MKILVLEGTYAITKISPKEDIPEWVYESKDFFTISRTNEELSIVCLENLVPLELEHEGRWRVLKVEGPLDFGMVGLLNQITKPLADAGIRIFAISTFNTDYILVKQEKLQKAMRYLKERYEIIF